MSGACLEHDGACVIVLRAQSGVEVWSAAHDIYELPDGRRDPLGYHVLDLPANALAGIAAFYSIIHISPEWLPDAFAELWRVLMPDGDGLLLLTFHLGQQTIHRCSVCLR